jgi:hypothetical protein
MSEIIQPAPPAPKSRSVQLPLGGLSSFYTREHMTVLYRCTHGELGRLLVRRMVPLPVRIEGQILWFTDEALEGMAQALRTLERWLKH